MNASMDGQGFALNKELYVEPDPLDEMKAQVERTKE